MHNLFADEVQSPDAVNKQTRARGNTHDFIAYQIYVQFFQHILLLISGRYLGSAAFVFVGPK